MIGVDVVGSDLFRAVLQIEINISFYVGKFLFTFRCFFIVKPLLALYVKVEAEIMSRHFLLNSQ